MHYIYQEQEKTNTPQAIGDLMKRFEKREEPVNSEDKAKHERAYYIELTRKELGNHWKTKKPYTFGMINGLTKNWSILKIKDRYFYCKKHANCEFGKAWFGLRLQDKKKRW